MAHFTDFTDLMNAVIAYVRKTGNTIWAADDINRSYIGFSTEYGYHTWTISLEDFRRTGQIDWLNARELMRLASTRPDFAEALTREGRRAPEYPTIFDHLMDDDEPL